MMHTSPDMMHVNTYNYAVAPKPLALLVMPVPGVPCAAALAPVSTSKPPLQNMKWREKDDTKPARENYSERPVQVSGSYLASQD